MKTIKINLLLLVVTIFLLGVIYPLFICGVGLLFPNQAEGFPLKKDNQIIGYKNIGQNFSDSKYFWGRPSACNYNPINAGPSNFGPSNPIFLKKVQQRIKIFLAKNPTIKKADIPSDIVTSSGSGIDPDISLNSAIIQIPRIAESRRLSDAKIMLLVDNNIQKPLFGIFGPQKINVLQLNLALDNLSKK